jgi:O-antigen/teichoic acid export membrane protein
LNTSKKASLKALAIRGSVWSLAAHGGVLSIRMARSLIMTRLLAPEAYGLMTLVWAVLFGLIMFSDTGIGPTIVRDPRGDEPDFLNTAFSTNVIRGGILWLIACLVGYPIAVAYQQPSLALLLPATGATSLIHGFVSTSIYTRGRHLDFKRLAILELSNEAVVTVVVLIWAYFFRDVWSIVVGSLVGECFRVLASHLFMPGIRNRFGWDRSALKTFMAFGKWIYLSSVVTFLSTQSDRFLLGKYVDMTHLGVYGTATVLTGAIQTGILKINADVLFPAFSRVVNEGTGRIRQVVFRTRLAIDVGIILPVAAIMILGGHIVDLLYDARYHEAGWMLQVLSIRLILIATTSNSESCLVALGHPKIRFIENVVRTIAMFVAIPIGWSLAGVKGVIWAIALSEMPATIVIWIGMMKHQMFSALIELRSLLFAGVGILVGFGLGQVWQ